MNKFKTLILAFIIILSSLFLLPVNANSHDWIKNEDGYHYYDLSNLTASSRFKIEVESDEILEVKDFVSGTYGQINRDGKNAKKLEIYIKMDGSYYQLWIKALTLDDNLIIEYPTQSYVSLDAIKDDVSIRKLSDIKDIPEDQFNTVDDLPATVENPNVYTMLGEVIFTIEGNTVLVRITYFGTFTLKYHFSEGTDMSIFETTEAYYLNFDDTPQIIINNSDRQYLKEILLSEITGSDIPAFVPTTIWDLKSNSLEQTKKYDASVYLKQNTTGAVVAYVYTDDFVIDNVLKARLTFTTREKIKFPFSITKGNYTEWITTEEEYEHTDFLEYKNKTMNWQDYVPVWNRIRMINKLLKSYTMPRIGKVDLNNIDKNYNVTMSELNKYYKMNNPDFETIKENSKYNLYAFALYENKSNWVEQTQFYNTENPDDERNFQIIEMLYQTNGKLYTTIGDDMDIELAPGGPGVDLPDDPNKEPAPSKIPIIILGVIVGLVIIGLFKGKEKISLEKLGNILLVLGLIAILTYLAYIFIIPQFLIVMLL